MYSILLDAIKDFALHAMLDLTTTHHKLQHLVDGVLRIFLRGREKGKRHFVKTNTPKCNNENLKENDGQIMVLNWRSK